MDMKKLLYYTCAIAILAINTDYIVAAPQEKVALPTSKEINNGLALFDLPIHKWWGIRQNGYTTEKSPQEVQKNTPMQSFYNHFYRLLNKIEKFREDTTDKPGTLLGLGLEKKDSAIGPNAECKFPYSLCGLLKMIKELPKDVSTSDERNKAIEKTIIAIKKLEKFLVIYKKQSKSSWNVFRTLSHLDKLNNVLI